MNWRDWREDICGQDDDCTCCPEPKPVVRLPIAVLPDKRKECCCTPSTCICKKPPLDNLPGSGKVGG